VSGIAGILDRGGRHAPAGAVMQRMLQAIRHRGRDGVAQWGTGEVALGHAHLRTTPDDEAQPLFDGHLAIVADVRLDNRKHLLEALGRPDRAISDAALILTAYRHWGEECPRRLLGDFAFAIWDGERKSLFCARDHFGVKPFYYHLDAVRLVFASETKAILTPAGIDPDFDEAHISGLLAGLADDPYSTHHAGILRLPPAHALAVTATRSHLWAYWELEPPATLPGTDHAQQFRELFDQAVNARLGDTDLAGAMLSGGLDSSSIAMIAGNRHRPVSCKGLPTFSLVFDKASGMDERPFIDAVLSNGEFDPAFIPIRDHAPFAGFDAILREQEGIFLAAGLSVSRKLYAAAAAKGLRVILDGHGGDEVVSHGHGFLHELARAGRWIALQRELRAFADTYGNDRTGLFLTFFNRYGPTRHFRPVRRLAGRVFSPFRRPRESKPKPSPWRRFINREFASRTNLPDRIGTHARLSREALKSEAAFHRRMISSAGVAHSFEVLDKAAAGAGIEPRYPFWDKRLVEFCVALPASEKLSNGWSRHILRRAMDGILPPEVQWRRDKIDFKGNLVRGMLRHHRPLLDSVLIADAYGIGEYVNLDELVSAYERMTTAPDSIAGDEVQFIWRSISLALWLDQTRRSDIAA